MTLDTLRDEGTRPAEQASPSWLNEGAGHSIRGIRRRRQADAGYKQRLMEAAHLYDKVLKGDSYAALKFSEAMSTSDFSILFADILDRQLLGSYQDWPSTWQNYARRGTTRDFRTVKRFFVDGGAATLDEVPERAEYPEAALTDGKYEYAVTKRGRKLDISWETLVNDDLDAFRDLPMVLGRAAKLTEDKFVTDLYAGTTGPDSTFFAAGNNNIVTSNPALSVTALQTAFTVMGSQKDTDGNPIFVQGVYLVVPPALEVTANNIINATEIVTAAGSGGTDSQAGRPDRLRAINWMRNRVQVIVNPWLPIISTTNGGTSWYLFASTMAGRPAMELGFLRGNEQPAVFIKAPDSMRIGGGMSPSEDGDFETDSVRHKVRHVLGGTLMDPKMAVASNGTGS